MFIVCVAFVAGSLTAPYLVFLVADLLIDARLVEFRWLAARTELLFVFTLSSGESSSSS
jgi:hypothetical protein